MEEKEVYITSDSIPFWKNVIAAICYTILFFFMYRFIKGMVDDNPSLLWFVGAIFAFMLGLTFSMRNGFHFDIKNKRFKEDLHVGPFTYGAWEPLPDLEYVSVFNYKEGFYQINLWIKGNDFYVIAGTDDLNMALETGKSIAKKLHIDLLDAGTDPRNSTWVELE